MLNSIVAYACKSSKPMDSDTENLFYVFKIVSRLVLGSFCGSVGKRICLQCKRPGFDPQVEKIPGEGKHYPLQYSGLENSMNCIVHGVAKSQT